MFIIGLELNPSKLWALRRSIFGVGARQMLITAVVIGALLYVAMWKMWQCGKFCLASCCDQGYRIGGETDAREGYEPQ